MSIFTTNKQFDKNKLVQIYRNSTLTKEINILYLIFAGLAVHLRAHRGQPAPKGKPHQGSGARAVPPHVRGL